MLPLAPLLSFLSLLSSLSLLPLSPQAVPAYIEKVHWGSMYESLEVYSLLDQIADARQSFPVEVDLSFSDVNRPTFNCVVKTSSL